MLEENQLENTATELPPTPKKSFVREAQEDQITNIHYKTSFLFPNLKAQKAYTGLSIINFEFLDYSEANQAKPLKLTFKGNIHCLAVNNALQTSINFSDETLRLDKDLFEDKSNGKAQEVILLFSIEFSPSYPFTGTGCFKYRSKENYSHYVYTQCEPDYTQAILPIFYNLNHKARFTLRFVNETEKIVVSNQNLLTDQQLPARTEANQQEWLETVQTAFLGLEGSSDAANSPLGSLEGITAIRDTQEFKGQLKEALEGIIEELPPDTLNLSVRQFEPTPVISFNLMVFAIGKYKKYECSPYKGKIPVDFYCEVGSETEELMEANLKRLEAITKAGLAFYEEFLGVDYAFSKYGNLFAPHFSFNAMENPGLVVINPTNLLDPAPEKIGFWKAINRDRMILHEMAHMWVGNLYTMNEWHDLWLKEATAEYFCHRSFAGILADPKRYDEGLTTIACRSEDIWVNFITRTAMNNRTEEYPYDSKKSFPVCFKNEKYWDELIDFYGTIVYQKGSSYMRNLEYLLGEGTFRKLFNTLLTKYAYSTLGSAEFVEELERVIKEGEGTLEDKEDKWVVAQNWFESHINIKGYPTIKVKKTAYEAESGVFEAEAVILWPKWTRVRALILGEGGRKLVREIEFGEPKDQLGTPKKVTWRFEGVDFKPLAFIPNFNYDDFVHTKFDLETVKNVFNPKLGLWEAIDEDVTLAYLVYYFQFFWSSHKEAGIIDAEFLIGFRAVVLLRGNKYLIQLSERFDELIKNQVREECAEGMFIQ